MHRWVVAVVAVSSAGCGRIAFDAAETDAGPRCDFPQQFFVDADGDGHGDPAQPLSTCNPPANAVLVGDDCDDMERYRYPGGTEVCDGIDNDCNAATVETCANMCQPARRPPPDDAHLYLLCGNEINYPAAAAACANEGFTLARVDDTTENAWIPTQLAARFMFNLADSWLDGSDESLEDRWQWSDGTVFWQGNFSGSAVGGHFTFWNSGEPNNGSGNGSENCLLLTAAAGNTWNDGGCAGTMRKFTCERN